jgi:flagellar hook assembly protein FlgD
VRAGAASVHWDGRDRRGHLVYGGRYVVRVRAVNGFGASELKQAFSARRA